MFHNRITKVLAALAALAALGLGGSAIAGAASSSTTSASQAAVTPRFHGPRPGTAAHEDAEKAVTGDSAAKAQAAAVKSVGSGTAGPVTTDYSGQGFEVAVTKADGTKLEVHLDRSYDVIQGPPGGPGGPPPGYGPAAPAN